MSRIIIKFTVLAYERCIIMTKLIDVINYYKRMETTIKSDHSLVNSEKHNSIVKKGEDLIRDIPIAFKDFPDHDELWSNINHEKYRLNLEGNYNASEASRVLQGLEDAVYNNTDI